MNLVPDTVPRDVYSDVAAVVESIREKDAKKGVRIAKMLRGHVKRKVRVLFLIFTIWR